jgi:hypothetical protein
MTQMSQEGKPNSPPLESLASVRLVFVCLTE